MAITNALIFNGCLAGIAGAQTSGRMPVSTVDNSLAVQAAATTAEAAIAVAAGALPGGGNTAQAALAEALCMGLFDGRLVSSTNAADYVNDVLNLGTDFVNLNAKLTGGGSGEDILPLTGVAYVDKNTTSVTQNGSIANPFTTLAAAIAAGFTNLLVTPGDYSAQTGGTLVIVGAGQDFSITGLGARSSDVLLGAINFSTTGVVGSSLRLNHLSCGNITDVSAVVEPVVFTIVECQTADIAGHANNTNLITGAGDESVPTLIGTVTGMGTVNLAFTTSNDITCVGPLSIVHSTPGNITGQGGAPVVCNIDSVSERAMYRAGKNFTTSSNIVSLDSNDGSASAFSVSAAIGAGGVLRAVAQPNTPAAQVITLHAAGASDKEAAFVDQWAGQDVVVKDDAAATLATLGAQAAGQGIRAVFKFSTGAGQFQALDSFRKL